MKRLLVSLFALTTILGITAVAQAAPIIYSSYFDFVTAFPNPAVENFQDATLEPGLSVVSTYPGAVIEDGVYKDIIGGANSYTTTWSIPYPAGFAGFGGWFDLNNPGGAGTGILVEVYYSGSATYETIGEIPNTFNGDFFGFSTGTVFDKVIFSQGSGAGIQETYWNVDLAYAPVPEPSTVLLLGFGLLGVAGLARKVRK